ncbi:uncharacterized protein LOC111715020 [Eurytemora carolleeae]|uniref:uncharacterized protein LOC111715020 n=1 Tax=Eurytemora carolleeae TaxID=1294199 RepID=UPI000C7572B6|nr:uncharacterized protein LOC111715020 [Eurytemora carolleeae]|eukprot:XP_023346025.1 uncharacterized protein LOC111715020 [Eurytemora affinis]
MMNRFQISKMLRFLDFGRQTHKFNFIQLRHAGHNKWSNIKHIKAAKDGIKSKRNAAFAAKINIAIKEKNGDVNTETNSALRKILNDARIAQVPKATIDTAIKNFKNIDAVEVTAEIKCAGGIILIAECLGKSRQFVHNELINILKKKSGVLEKGGLISMFERKGVIIAELTSSDNLDSIEDDAIEAGAEEATVLSTEAKTVEFLCSPVTVGQVRQYLEEHGYTCIDAAVNFIPLIPANPSPVDRKYALAVIEALEASSLVTAVHPNF